MQNGKIKVMTIITRMGIGGSPIIATLLAAGLDKSRFEPLLVTGVVSDIDGDMSYLADEYNIKPITIPELGRDIGLRNDLVSLYKLIKFIKKEKPDLVHTHQAKAGTLGRVSAILSGVPCIVHTFHGHVLHSYFGRLKSTIFMLIERFLARFTSRLIVISPLQFDEICGKFRLAPSDKFSVVPLGFDLTQFLSSDAHVGKLRKELGIPKDVFLVGMVGRLTGVKNHELFLRCASNILKKIANIRFVIVGDGELSEELKAFAKELGIQDKVIFLGWRRDMPLIYADLDIVALTSLNEGTPVTLIEAMASGKPVVSTAVGGVPDIVADGQSGILVPSEDEEKLSNAIVDLIKDPNRRLQFGKYGREFVEKNYTKERMLSNMAQLYEDLRYPQENDKNAKNKLSLRFAIKKSG